MLGTRALVCIVLSVLLMYIGQSSLPFMQTTRALLGMIVLPLEYVVDAPIKFVQRLSESISSQHQLIAENASLRAHDFLLQARLQRLLALEKENGELRELLRSSSHLGSSKVVVAQLLAVDLDPNQQQLIVNKGTKHKIYVGQPVLDAFGVMGQIVSVGPVTSKVLLLTDARSAIPVQSYRNGVRAVALGRGNSGTLILSNIPEATDIRQGDLFVTSGLGQRYPIGYPVGIVLDIQHVPGEHYNLVLLRPLAHLDRAQQVLLSWPDNAQLAKTVQQQLAAELPSL